MSLKEALPISIAKQYTKLSNNKYKTLYPEIFPEGKDRVYFPLKMGEVQDSPVYHLVAKSLPDYELDYIGGYAKKGKQVLKIGKLLKAEPELQKAFSEDPIRGQSKILVVISRHPYDVAGMSTDRAWQSCMNIYDGKNKHFVQKDIEQGTIVAYMISSSDKNITHPHARVLIKPYIAEDGEVALLASAKIYGIKNRFFRDTVQDILDELYNSYKKDPSKKYYFNKELYDDFDEPYFMMQDEVLPLKNGIKLIKRKGRHLLIDANGTNINNQRGYDTLYWEMTKNIASYTKDGKFGFIWKKTGEEITDNRYLDYIIDKDEAFVKIHAYYSENDADIILQSGEIIYWEESKFETGEGLAEKILGNIKTKEDAKKILSSISSVIKLL